MPENGSNYFSQSKTTCRACWIFPSKTASEASFCRLQQSTVAIGMGIRAGIGDGIALSFIAVATAFNGALLLGWRAAVTALGRRRS